MVLRTVSHQGTPRAARHEGDCPGDTSPVSDLHRALFPTRDDPERSPTTGYKKESLYLELSLCLSLSLQCRYVLAFGA